VHADPVDPHHPDGDVQALQHLGLVVGEHETGEHDRVHALAHWQHLEKALPALHVAEVVQQQVVAGLMQHALDSAQHLGEIPAMHERDDDADRCRTPARESRRERGRDVVQLSRGCQHPVPGRSGDIGQPAQRT